MNISLDVKRLAEENGIKHCQHPLDGGNTVSRLIPVNEGDDFYVLFARNVKEYNIRGVYEAEIFYVQGHNTKKQVPQFKVRILL